VAATTIEATSAIRVVTPNPEYEAAMASRGSDVARGEELGRELQEARDDAEAVRQRQTKTESMLQRATSGTSGPGPAVFDPSTWTGVVGAYTSRFEAELRAQRACEERIAALTKELDEVQRRQRVAVRKELSQSVVEAVRQRQTETESMLHRATSGTRGSLLESPR